MMDSGSAAGSGSAGGITAAGASGNNSDGDYVSNRYSLNDGLGVAASAGTTGATSGTSTNHPLHTRHLSFGSSAIPTATNNPTNHALISSSSAAANISSNNNLLPPGLPSSAGSTGGGVTGTASNASSNLGLLTNPGGLAGTGVSGPGGTSTASLSSSTAATALHASALPPAPPPSSLSSSSSSAAAATSSTSTPTSILDTSLARPRGDVNLSIFSLLFSELVQYSRNRVDSVTHLEEKLALVGYRVGVAALELVCYREKITKRETRLLGMLNFVVTTLWRNLFNKQADALKKVNDSNDEYYIEEHEPIVNRFISVPKDYGSLNCGAFIAGILQGVLDASNFPAKVTTYSKQDSATNLPPSFTIYFMKFDPKVMAREKLMTS